MSTVTEIRPIINDADLERTLAQISALSGRANLGEVEQGELDALVTLACEYERKRFPTPERDPIDVIHGAIDFAGHDPFELGKLWGSLDVAVAVMSRQAPLTIEMIHAVSDAWGIPIAMLMRKSRPLETDRSTRSEGLPSVLGID